MEALRATELEVSLIVYRNEYAPSVDATAVSTHIFNSCGCFFFFFVFESWDVKNKPEADIFFLLAFPFTACLLMVAVVFVTLFFIYSCKSTPTNTQCSLFYIHLTDVEVEK